jgi:DNA (cytosine-5)-methyltransferase 1
VSRPRILDLYCGPGGAATGYHQAGFDVVGVDIEPQPRYPFKFRKADALTYLAVHGHEYDAIHASPPCPRFANVTRWRGNQDDHPDLLTPTLHMLGCFDVPWVVENVPEAPLRRDLILCGTQFGLAVKRHRVFQFGNWQAFQLLPPCHHHRRLLPFMHKAERAYADAMGCTWMTKYEARQAVPPAFTEFIGEMLLHHLYPPGAAVLPNQTAAAPGHHNSQGARFGTLRAPWGSVPNVPRQGGAT